MTDLVEGEEERFEFRWRKTSTGLLTTGSPTVGFWVEDGDTKKWLQSDDTLSSTEHRFDLTYDSSEEAWVFEFSGVPSSLRGFTVTYVAEHPDHPTEITRSFRVTENDLDTVGDLSDPTVDFG